MGGGGGGVYLKAVNLKQPPFHEYRCSDFIRHHSTPDSFVFGVCAAVIRVLWPLRGEFLRWGGRGCPIINPLPVAPTVQMVPEAHMASNPVSGILLAKLPPTPPLLPPPSRRPFLSMPPEI